MFGMPSLGTVLSMVSAVSTTLSLLGADATEAGMCGGSEGIWSFLAADASLGLDGECTEGLEGAELEIGASSLLLAAPVVVMGGVLPAVESVTKAGAGAGSDGGLAPAWEASRLSYRTNRKTWAGQAPLFLRPPVVEAL